MSEAETDMPWWVIHSDDLLKMLRRAGQGEDPGALLAEWYANSDHEHVGTPRARQLDELTVADPAGAFALLLYLHGPDALGLRSFNMRDLDIDAVGRCSFPRHRPPYYVLPDESEDW